MNGDARKIHRLPPRRDDFLTHGFTEGCPGCQALLAATSRQGHSEACRRRMQTAIKSMPSGQSRMSRQEERENQQLARRIEEEDRLNEKNKKARRVEERGEKRRGHEEGQEAQDLKKGRSQLVTNPSSSSFVGVVGKST